MPSEPTARPRSLSGAAGSTDLDPDATPVLFTGQQSNTSVMFGDQAMIKFFRRIELGPNLDIEVHDALARAGVDDVARLYGWARGTWIQDGTPVEADLAMAVEKLAEAEDGWGLALDSLRAETDFAEDAALLGRALAQIHQALRAAFPTAEVDGEATEAIMNSRLRWRLRSRPRWPTRRQGCRRRSPR